TWVDNEPWGFAPFHYGRWVAVGGVWGWVPCPPRPAVVTVAYVRPVYAPALVAWVGGAHWGVGVAVGSAPATGVAWFPLGPRDVYCPSYRVSQTYVTNVNVSNTTIINRTQVTNVYNNVYVNKTVNVTKDRKSTRLNSSHDQISYAVFCLKKKKKKKKNKTRKNKTNPIKNQTIHQFIENHTTNIRTISHVICYSYHVRAILLLQHVILYAV